MKTHTAKPRVCRLPRRLLPWAAAMLLTIGITVTLSADQEWHYVEGESYSAHDHGDLRSEGFTAWLGHPSGGKVAVILAPGGWLEYEVKDLGPGPYYVYVRALAWNERINTELFWDGQEVGQISFAQPDTRLKWSNLVGRVSGPGSHKLRLESDPSNNPNNAPYLDVILLTTDPNYTPDNLDQDFVSVRSPLPALRLASEQGPRTIAPQPGAQIDAHGDIELREVRLDFPQIGSNQVYLLLISRINSPRSFRIAGQFGDSPPAELLASIRGGMSEPLVLNVDAGQPGKVTLKLTVSEGTRQVLAGSYTVDIPNPIGISLDGYAYPVGTAQAVWRADLSAMLEGREDLSIQVAMRPEGIEEWRSVAFLTGTSAAQEVPIDLSKLPVGRYTVRAAFTRQGRPMYEDDRDFIIYTPSELTAWEPVQKTQAVGDTIYLNGRPFLGLLLSHAGAGAVIREQGFNLVVAAGWDPDPLPSIKGTLDYCAEVGMWAMAALFNNSHFRPGDASRFDVDRVRQAVLAVKDHPALLGWNLVDEPEINNMAPEHVAEVANMIRELDPNHIIWVNLCRPDRFTAYLASQDLWSFDLYPIPSMGPFGYATSLQVSDESIRGRRPLGTFLQTYNPPGVRMPTPDELRCSAYLHILHGYKWFGYYSYHESRPETGSLENDPVLWSFVRALNDELRQLAPVILAEGKFEPIEASLPRDSFRAGIKQVGDERYLIAVSGSKEPITVSMKITGQGAETLFEAARELPIREGILRESFRPYEVHVYRLK